MALDTPTLETPRLRLTPLALTDAEEMVEVLADERLYRFTGGKAPLLTELGARYLAQIAGPTDAGEVWHNWIIRLTTTGSALGFAQATVNADKADLAWLVGTDWQRRGFGTEAATVMCDWLVETGTRALVAHIQPDHVASSKLAISLGLTPTDVIDSDGEVIWERLVPC